MPGTLKSFLGILFYYILFSDMLTKCDISEKTLSAVAFFEVDC